MKRRLSVVLIVVLIIQFFPFGPNEVRIIVLSQKPQVDAEPRTKATPKEKRDNKVMAMSYASAGWGWDTRQKECIKLLFSKESKFDHLAKNLQGSSAFGIGQVLKEKSKDPRVQVLRAYKYIVHRYDTPCNAWAFHQRRNWY